MIYKDLWASKLGSGGILHLQYPQSPCLICKAKADYGFSQCKTMEKNNVKAGPEGRLPLMLAGGLFWFG